MNGESSAYKRVGSYRSEKRPVLGAKLGRVAVNLLNLVIHSNGGGDINGLPPTLKVEGYSA